MKEWICRTPEDTFALGKALGQGASPGAVFAFFGGLGAGKTALTRGIAAGLGYEGEVASPTFALVHEYRGGRLPLFHFDMYRISGWDDLYSTGFFEYLEENGVLAVEWSENIEGALPEGSVHITLEPLPDGSRRITAEGEEF